MRVIKQCAVIAVLGASVVIAAPTALHATPARPSHRNPAEKNHCPNNKKYLQALTATDKHGVVTISGHHAVFFCSKDAEFIKTRKAPATFTLVKGASINVYKNPFDPTSTHAIAASKFPAYLKKNQKKGENWYTFKGPATAVTKIVPAFQS